MPFTLVYVFSNFFFFFTHLDIIYLFLCSILWKHRYYPEDVAKRYQGRARLAKMIVIFHFYWLLQQINIFQQAFSTRFPSLCNWFCIKGATIEVINVLQ